MSFVRSRRPGRPTGRVPTNYRVVDKGREYRICAMSHGRVLFVGLKHKRKEQALDPSGRRFRELVELARKQYKVELYYHVA